MKGPADVQTDCRAVALVYGASFLQGLTLVSFSASSSVLRDVKGFTNTPQAALALSSLLAMVALGRLCVSALFLKVPAEWVRLILPLLMVCGFLLLPFAHTGATGIAFFALAGLARSAFFPVTVGLASRRFPSSAAFVSSFIIAALMMGVGIGSYVIGPLRTSPSLERRLYQFSALYPAAAFFLALSVVGNMKTRLRAQKQEE